MLSGNYSNFQIPNNPGQPTAFVVNGRTNFNSAKLDENQAENSAYGILTYQKKSDDFNMQASVFTRYSGVLFRPMTSAISSSTASPRGWTARSTPTALEVDAELQAERSNTRSEAVCSSPPRTLRSAVPHLFSQSMPWEIRRVMCRSASSIIPRLNGYFAGFYLQDEWKPFEQLTINFGGRIDVANDDQDGKSIQPAHQHCLHTLDRDDFPRRLRTLLYPPPLENVDQSYDREVYRHDQRIRHHTRLAGESGAGPLLRCGRDTEDQETVCSLASMDFYKHARNVLDEGQFGQALILSSFNYREGEIYGGEFTANYEHGGFSSYLNVGLRICARHAR